MIGITIHYEISNYTGLIDIERVADELSYGRAGVYLLHSNEDLLYIGKSAACVRGRINNHVSPTHDRGLQNRSYINKRQSLSKEIKQVSVIYADFDDVHLLEVFLITKFKPKYNRSFVNKKGWHKEKALFNRPKMFLCL